MGDKERMRQTFQNARSMLFKSQVSTEDAFRLPTAMFCHVRTRLAPLARFVGLDLSGLIVGLPLG